MMDGFEKLQDIELQPREAFYSTLIGGRVSQANYEHAQCVIKEMSITSMREYHDLYLKTDMLLLCDVFENFRDVCSKYYELAWYPKAPGLAYDAALKTTGVKLELISDHDMLFPMFEKGIRGQITVATHRYAKANKLLGVCECKQPVWMGYEQVPTDRWINPKAKPTFDSLTAEDEKGFVLEVDFEYSKELHDHHNDYLLAPEAVQLNKVKKLVSNLGDKKKN